jgi:hypothetical protein
MRAFTQNPPFSEVGNAMWRRGIAQRMHQGCIPPRLLSNTDFRSLQTFRVWNGISLALSKTLWTLPLEKPSPFGQFAR